MNKRRVFGAAAAFIIAAAFAPLFGLEVDRKELESVNGAGIVFQSYSGPHTIINSVEQIRAIGSNLAPSIKNNPDNFAKVGNSAKYSIIHAVDPNTKEKLDADILVIGANATVDHIKNLRRIISAYLMSAYGYSRQDADTLAAFATVYNAVYRGNVDNFSSKYKKIVLDNISQGLVGLSTNYQEWPGATQIVIPLFDVHGGLSTVDSNEIAKKEVIDSLRDEDDMGIDARKGMVDIKDRQADQASENADEAQKKADEEAEKAKEEAQKAEDANKEASNAAKDANNAQKNADEAQKQADYAQKQADESQKDADEAQKAADEKQKEADEAAKKAQENPDDKNAQEEAEKKQAEADAAQKQADNAQKQADEKQKTADEKQANADEKQKTADEKADDAQKKQNEAQDAAQKAQDAQKKAEEEQANADEKQKIADDMRKEIQEERDQIAKDQEELMNRENVAEENVLYGLKNVDEIGMMSAIVKMDSKTGALIKESPVSVIRSRTVFQDGGNFVAIAGTNFGNGAIKLVLIDRDKLEIIAESAEVLSETSVLVEAGGAYYCVVRTEAAKFVVGKFNNNAQLIMKSDVPVKSATPITVTKKGIMVTATNGKPILLSEKDLSAVTPDAAK